MVVLMASHMDADELKRAIKRAHSTLEAQQVKALSFYQKAGEA
jgi:hypothetical protein